MTPKAPHASHHRVLASERQVVEIQLDGSFQVIGERINPTGKKKLKAMGDDWKTIRRECNFVLASDVTNPLCGVLGNSVCCLVSTCE